MIGKITNLGFDFALFGFSHTLTLLKHHDSFFNLSKTKHGVDKNFHYDPVKKRFIVFLQAFPCVSLYLCPLDILCESGGILEISLRVGITPEKLNRDMLSGHFSQFYSQRVQ